MKAVRITVIRKTCYPDLMEQYENPLDNACDVEEGMTWMVHHAQCPEGFCASAWDTLAPFVEELSRGGGNFYGNWMKNPHSALLSCNDGFRPVSFYLEMVEHEG